jgi:hypothetical protein
VKRVNATCVEYGNHRVPDISGQTKQYPGVIFHTIKDMQLLDMVFEEARCMSVKDPWPEFSTSILSNL